MTKQESITQRNKKLRGNAHNLTQLGGTWIPKIPAHPRATTQRNSYHVTNGALKNRISLHGTRGRWRSNAPPLRGWRMAFCLIEDHGLGGKTTRITPLNGRSVGAFANLEKCSPLA
ncbi:hypothetical protein [Saccharopolyspora spinosa]|uniref:hypothetical protein n=1 Tax=Saccharopolyspora spinosa TaxID=60894 RepID=UPI00117A4C2A|nr:hypothetical protein [Saccharopolyspora spinosa]